TLDRPERLNAFTARMMHELLDAFERADADDAVRAIIVTGAGRAFCAGADLGSGGATFDHSSGPQAQPIEEHRDGGGLVTLRIFASKKPVIAAINGAAVGVGITMTLPMDVRIAASGARIGFVFARRGIVAEACSSWFLPRVVGISRAAEWVLTGRVFPAEEALAGGLVSRVVAPEALLDTARALARAHERPADAGAPGGTPHRDALGLYAPRLRLPEARRADRVPAVEGEKVQADGVVGVHLLVDRHALFLYEHLAPDGEAALELVGAGASNLEHATRAARRHARTRGVSRRPSVRR